MGGAWPLCPPPLNPPMVRPTIMHRVYFKRGVQPNVEFKHKRSQGALRGDAPQDADGEFFTGNFNNYSYSSVERSSGGKCVYVVYLLSLLTSKFCFYRATHYSAKRGLEITCHLSVCLSIYL